MSRARLLHLLSQISLPTLVLTSLGCEVVLGDLPRARSESASGATGAGGAGGGGAGGTGGVGGDAGAGGTGAATSSATSGSGGCCDCDGDQANALGACQGDDCDDGDARAHPGQTMYFGTPAPQAGFDFDCNGVSERDPRLAIAVDCSGLALPCDSAVGFLGVVPPACGVHADWGTCKANGLVCAEDVIELQKVMTCK